jgi:hypothetical protein
LSEIPKYRATFNVLRGNVEGFPENVEGLLQEFGNLHILKRFLLFLAANFHKRILIDVL